MKKLAYQRIDDCSSFDQALEALRQCNNLAIDLEFDKNRFRYGFNLCLMQLATDKDIFLIDPLAKGVDIERVFPVLESPEVKKVAFEFGEDLRLLHALGCKPQHLEDLSNASKLLGYSQLSLTNLVASVLDVELGQGSQMSNWFQRPLTSQQCSYAADDVRYLFQLREVLMSQLLAADEDRLQWYAQENAFFLKDAIEKEREDTGISLSKDDRKALNQVQYHALQALYQEREKLAEQHNRPVFKIFTSKGLLDLVQSDPDKPSIAEKEIGLKSMRTTAVYEKWKKTLKQAREEASARGLKSDQPAFLPLDDEEKRMKRDEQKRINRLVEEEWKPIQAVLKKRFGQEMATFMLSNRTMKRLAAGESNAVPPYRMVLFDSIRSSLK